MYNVAGLREFASSGELTDYCIRLAVRDQNDTQFLDASSSVSPEVEKNFYEHITEFTNHLDQIINLVNDSEREPSEKQLTKEASAMHQSLYQARLLFKDIKFNSPDPRTRAIGLAYAHAQNCYYYYIRPHLLDIKDLDIPHLNLFSFVSTEDMKGIIQPIQFRHDYQQSLKNTLEELIYFKARPTDLSRSEIKIKEILHEELVALTNDLVNFAEDLIPPMKFPAGEYTFAGNFEAFVEELNDCLESAGEWFDAEDLHSAIYGASADSTKTYRNITDALLEAVGPNNAEPSKAVRLLLLLFLMKLYGSAVHEDSSCRLDDLDQILLLKLNAQAMSQATKNYEQPIKGKLRVLQEAYKEASAVVTNPVLNKLTNADLISQRKSLKISDPAKLLLGINEPDLLKEFEELLSQDTETRKASWFSDLTELGGRIIDTVYTHTKNRMNINNCPFREARQVMQFIAIKLSQNV